MQALFFLIGIYTNSNVTAQAQLCDTIDICDRHLFEEFGGEKFERLNEFKKVIFDDNCILETYHIDVCDILLGTQISSCKKCFIPFSDVEMQCKKCSSSKISKQSCENCELLILAGRCFEMHKLCMRKFILNKFSEETVEYFFEIFRPNISTVDVLRNTSGITYNLDDMNILSNTFSELTHPENIYLVREISFLSAFTKYHPIYKEKDSMELFNELLECNEKNSGDLAFYLALRFDFNFYQRITSKDLFNLITAFTSPKLNLNFQEYETLIINLTSKADFINFVLDEEHFYKLIDLYVEKDGYVAYLIHFFKSPEYLKMLTEDKIFSMLLRMFRIKSLHRFKNLRAFNNDSACTQQIEEDISNEKFDSNSFYNQFIEISENNLLGFTDIYLAYRSIVEILLFNYNGFSSNERVKLACIIFSFLNPEINQQIIFEDLLTLYYSNQKFDKFTAENILDLIDLHLIYNIPYDYVEPSIQPIFANIKSGDELDKIFDHVFASKNKNILLGMFVEMYDSKKLSESKLNQLIDFLIYELQDKTKEFFEPIISKNLLSISFQRKCILRMIKQANINNFEFFECIDNEVFETFSKKELDSLFQFCLLHKKIDFISVFVKYLDFNQANQIGKTDLDYISTIISRSSVMYGLDSFKYIGTPYLYVNLPQLLSLLWKIFSKNEDAFYVSLVFESTMENPLLQKCIDYSQSIEPDSNIFENAYIVEITKTLRRIFQYDRKMCSFFYDQLNSDMKFILKATLIHNIIKIIDKDIKIHIEMSVNEKINFVKSIIDQCIALPQDLKYEKFELFLNNFDSSLFYLASQQYPESFKRLILDWDIEYLIKIYNRQIWIRSCFTVQGGGCTIL